MTREEAIKILKAIRVYECYTKSASEETKEAIDMAIEALQFIEHFDLLKEYQSLQEVVRCKDCKNRESDACPMFSEEWFTIDEGDGYVDDDYREHDYTTDEGYCHRGERREDGEA